MSLTYSTQKNFKEEDLKELFTSVGWIKYSANYPDRLVRCMKNSDTVFSCWDNNKLVGLASSMSDSFHVFLMYLLVHEKYQGQGIGAALFKQWDKYYNNHYKILVSQDAKKYYPRFGYNPESDVAYFENFDLQDYHKGFSQTERWLMAHKR